MLIDCFSAPRTRAEEEEELQKALRQSMQPEKKVLLSSQLIVLTAITGDVQHVIAVSTP